MALHWIYSSAMLEQEGRKPCQIISPQLTVGGHIQADASYGNTNIMINNRKITTTERLMLRVVVLDTIWLFYNVISLKT